MSINSNWRDAEAIDPLWGWVREKQQKAACLHRWQWHRWDAEHVLEDRIAYQEAAREAYEEARAAYDAVCKVARVLERSRVNQRYMLHDLMNALPIS